MKGGKGFTLIELLVVIAIIAVLAAILFPVFAKARNAAKRANCESNMKQIAHAIKMYLSDWEDTYPPNRRKSGPHHLVVLSDAGVDAGTGDPYRFWHGIAWVEALYAHIEPAGEQGEQSSVWRCQAARNLTYPANSKTARVSYVFNFTLCEEPEGMIKGAADLYMVREVDRLVDSLARPIYTLCTGDENVKPQWALLNKFEVYLKKTDNLLHANGSHVLFADGHVKLYTADYFPEQSHYNQANCWDDRTNQWFNYGPGASMPAAYLNSIGITL